MMRAVSSTLSDDGYKISVDHDRQTADSGGIVTTTAELAVATAAVIIVYSHGAAIVIVPITITNDRLTAGQY